MGKQTSTYKKVLLIAFIVLLSCPFVAMFAPINVTFNIHGTSAASASPKLSVASLFDGTYQESLTKYLNDEIGYFELFVKLHNQIEFSLFDKVHSGNVVVGKNNYLFDKSYIDTYYGQDFIGSPKIKRVVNVLDELQDSLEARGKILVYCLATGKATFFPEYIPYEEEKDSTNNEVMVQEFQKRGINHINFAPYLLELKKEHGDLLFPKYGVHWSYFANIFVADSLSKYIEHKTGWDLPNIEITEMKFSEKPKHFDNDIGNVMNLFDTLQPDRQMAYPEFKWNKPVDLKKKKVLFISDSFGWDLFENIDFGKDCFSEMQLWFYYQAVYSKTIKEGRLISELPLLSRHVSLHNMLMEYDAFVILTNEPNNVLRGWGFPKDALMTLKDSNHVREERGNEFLYNQCYDKKEWREGLEKLAEERNITFEEMVEIYLHDRNFTLDTE